MSNSSVKAGPITLAVGLVIIGGVILAYNFQILPSLETVWKLWPLLLIGVSAEYLIRKKLAGANSSNVHFHVPSLLLIGLLIIFGSTVNVLASSGLTGLIRAEVLGEGQTCERTWQGDPVPVTAGSRVVVDSGNEQVQIRPSMDGKVHVSARIWTRAVNQEKAQEMADQLEIKVEPGDPLRITTDTGALTRAQQHWRNIMYDVVLTVAVPAGLQVEVESDNGRIEAADVAGQFRFTSENGRIEASNITGNMELGCGNGEIRTVNVKGNLKLDTRNGSITVRDPGGDVVARTNNGHLKLDSKTPLAGRYDLSTGNGQLQLFLPKNSDLKISAETRNGQINSSILSGSASEGRVTEASGVLGAGKGTAVLRTANGEIEIHAYEQ